MSEDAAGAVALALRAAGLEPTAEDLVQLVATYPAVRAMVAGLETVLEAEEEELNAED